jgi:hypothetical protein
VENGTLEYTDPKIGTKKPAWLRWFLIEEKSFSKFNKKSL